MSDGFSDDLLTQTIIACMIKVHRNLGPGFLESIYHNALLVELELQRLSAESESEVAVFYEGVQVGLHRLDIVVEDQVIIELKAVEDLSGVHYAQVRSYLKASGLKTAILVNFAKEKADFRRIETQ